MNTPHARRTPPLLVRSSLAAAALLAGYTLAAAPSDWPSWRGPAGTGSTSHSAPLNPWPADPVAWKTPLPGKGSSTPIVWNDRIYLTCPADGEDAVLAFDLQGKQLWQTKLGQESPPRHRTLGSSCNSSPVTDGQAVFVYFRSGAFAALELDGKIRWQHNLVDRFGAERLFWDQGSSPIVTDRHVILTRMHQGESWVAGFDKATGELQWRQPRQFKTPTENDNGYSTPFLFQHQGRPALLVWGADHATAHDAADGSLLWTAGGFNPDATGFWPAIASPLIHDQIAIIPVGRDDRPNQARLFGIKLGGSGDVSASHRAWQRDDLGVFVTAPAEYNGRIYLLRHRGEIVCLDPKTGQTLWSETLPRASSPFYASPAIAQDTLFAAREDGTLFAAKVGEKFELLGSAELDERIVATPVPTGPRLLLRGDRHLFCLAAK